MRPTPRSSRGRSRPEIDDGAPPARNNAGSGRARARLLDLAARAPTPHGEERLELCERRDGRGEAGAAARSPRGSRGGEHLRETSARRRVARRVPARTRRRRCAGAGTRDLDAPRARAPRSHATRATRHLRRSARISARALARFARAGATTMTGPRSHAPPKVYGWT
jgi:hypothetical protein